ncbi:response regulator [Ohtaekwangia kribbensis]|jgi:CheY-like chemotaxis protein|uniref:Response regulator n=1 Tax=Ohtaekwangia kribbensis TaxID=688913 RepID=A0ABW3JV97_9BACT
MSNIVLLVDDEPVFNFIAESHIKRIDPSSEVFSVFNGKEAIDLLNNSFMGQVKIPTHIFLDINMPVMDGMSFLAEYQKLSNAQTAGIKIVILTTSNNPLDKARAQSYHIEYYINKPISTENLKSILNI